MNGDRSIEYRRLWQAGSPLPLCEDLSSGKEKHIPTSQGPAPITADADYHVVHFVEDPEYRGLTGYWRDEQWRRL